MDDEMTVETPPTGDPVTPPADPNADELAALRKEKADREAADAKARDDELADLRTYKQTQEAKRTPVKTPVPKADKTETPPATPPAGPSPRVRRRGKSGAARSWFGEEDE
jgi:hypothetical protein